MARAFQQKIGGIIAAMSVTALMIGTPAAAQNGGDDQEFQGELGDRSPKSEGNPYEVRTVTLRADNRYAFSAESDDFDTRLRLSFADDNDETLVENDDGGDGTNAYLEYIPDSDGTYRVRIASYDSTGGSYVLKIRELPPLPRPLQPTPTATSTIDFRHFTGSLTDSDGEIGGKRVDDFLFDFEAGKRVFLFLDGSSDELDPLLEVHTMASRGSTDPVASNDDGDGSNSVLVFTPEESGEYIVRATGYSAETDAGDYELTVGQEP